jgi:hypothetical protein
MIHLYYVGLFVWSGSVKIIQCVPPCLITMQPLSSRLLRVCTCASALPTPSIPFFLFWTSIYALADIHFTFQFRFLSNLSLSLSDGQSIDSLQSTCNGHTHALTHTHTYHSFTQVENLADYQKPPPAAKQSYPTILRFRFCFLSQARLFFLIISLYPTWIIAAGKDQKSKWIKGEKTSRICFFSFSLVFKK